MKKHATILVTALLLAAFAGVSAASRQTLEGEYRWGGSGGRLEAVFTSTGAGLWNVDFHFRLQGRDHVYSGTARGSLVDGDLEGRVRTENKRRTFTFRGTFEDGVFRGTHAELQDGREHKTGTLTLRR